MNSKFWSLLFSLLAVSASALPRMVPVSDATNITAQSSNPSGFTRAGSRVFFTATDATHGTELWSTDGTAAGTKLVADFVPGTGSSSPRILGTFADAVIFTIAASNNTGAVWRSDGTAAGTYRLMSAPPASWDGTVPVTFANADSRLFLVVDHAGTDEVWVSDGGADDARRVASGLHVAPAPAPVAVSGKLYFVASDHTFGAQFWVSDGTLLGTHMFSRGRECPPTGGCGPLPKALLRLGSGAYFTTDTGLWRTDGTQDGTAQIFAMDSLYLTAAGHHAAYFTTPTALVSSNGTTTTIVDALDGPVHGTFLDDGRFVFKRWGGHVWRSDGTAAGTVKLGHGGPTSSVLGTLGTRVFVSGYTTQTGTELWSYDAETGVGALVKDIDPRETRYFESSEPGPGATLGGRFIFSAGDVHGREVWESDGTATGTKLLANIAADPGAGIVSGIVRDAVSTNPVAGATIVLCTPGECLPRVITGSDGRYRFEGVIPGTYGVRATSMDHVEGEIGSINVSSGFETQGVDFSLARGGRISGTVTRASTGEQLTLDIVISESDGSFVERLRASPAYRSRALRPGTYMVETRGWSSGKGVVDQVYRGVNCSGPQTCDYAAAQHITVTEGGEVTGIDFALQSFGTITGTITDATGLPLGTALFEYIPVSLNRGSSDYVPSTYSSRPMAPGAYYVAASAYGFQKIIYPNIVCTTYPCNYAGATPVNVTVDSVTSNINFALPAESTRVSGIVRGGDGALLQFASVTMRSQNYGGIHSATTDAEGRYAFMDLAPGTYVPAVAGETFDAVVVTNGQTVRRDIQAQARRTRIQGRVLDAATGTGIPYDRGMLLLYDADKTYIGNHPLSDTGFYDIAVVSRSQTFYLSAQSSGYKHTAYGTGRVTCADSSFITCALPPSAAPIAAGDRTGIDISLPRLGRIYGTITDADSGGRPLSPMTVSFFSTTTGAHIASAGSEPDGTFVWQNAEAGTYYALIRPSSSYRGQVWQNIDCDTCTPSSGAVITVGDGADVRGIDFRLQPLNASGKITGRVIDDTTGAPLAGVRLVAKNASGTQFGAITDANGNFTILREAAYLPLATGAYSLYAVLRHPYLVTVYGGGTCLDEWACANSTGTPVQVNAPATTSDVIVRLKRQSITSISPASGPTFGGTTLTINGTSFVPGSTVRVGGIEATVLDFAANQIVVRTPRATSAGPAHVSVHATPNHTVALAHAFTYAMAVFTDDPLAAKSTRVKAVHITELRAVVNQWRAAASLAPFAFTGASLSGAAIRPVHILELRIALDQARAALSLPALQYTNTPGAGTPIRAIDLQEIRAGAQ